MWVKRLLQVFNFKHVKKEKQTMETEQNIQEEVQESSRSNSVGDSWPGPDQWYRGPLEFFEEIEKGSSETWDQDEEKR